jgi:hypothetical protein
MRRLICIFLIANSTLMASEIPVGSLVSDRLFSVSRELYGRGLLDRFEYAAIDTPGSAGNNVEGLIEQFHQLCGEFHRPYVSQKIYADLNVIESNRERVTNSNFIKLFPRANIDFSPKLSADILYRVDGELSRDPRYDGKTWRGIAGFAEDATINYRSGGFEARFGIERLSWGYADYGNLMFAKQAMPMTLLAASYRRWIFDFETATAFLNPLKSEMDLTNTDSLNYFTSQQRYLSTHSITLRPTKSLSLSARETVVYGGPGRRLEPAYLLPFIWYHGQQLNSRFDDNILGSLGADWRFRGRLWLYSEVLIDDIQVEHSGRGNKEPNQLGYLAGTEIYDLPLKHSTIAIEYERVDNWTYNQYRDHNRYINQNYPIGFPDGPDVDVIDWRFSWWPAKYVRLSYLGLYRRHGEGRIDTPWSRPWLNVDNYSESFPTGVVERQATHGLEIMALDKNWLWGNFGLKYTDIVNVANITGDHAHSWELWFDMGIKIPPLIWGF